MNASPEEGDVTLTVNTALYSSRKNLAPREINDLGCAKTDLVVQPNGYTQLMCPPPDWDREVYFDHFAGRRYSAHPARRYCFLELRSPSPQGGIGRQS